MKKAHVEAKMNEAKESLAVNGLKSELETNQVG